MCVHAVMSECRQEALFSHVVINTHDLCLPCRLVMGSDCHDILSVVSLTEYLPIQLDMRCSRKRLLVKMLVAGVLGINMFTRTCVTGRWCRSGRSGRVLCEIQELVSLYMSSCIIESMNTTLDKHEAMLMASFKTLQVYIVLFWNNGQYASTDWFYIHVESLMEGEHALLCMDRKKNDLFFSSVSLERT